MTNINRNEELWKQCSEINQFLRDEERRIQSKHNHPSNPRFAFTTNAGSTTTTNNSWGTVITTTPYEFRSIARKSEGETLYVKSAEFPEGGDPRFRAVLAEMLRIHISKSNDYGTGADPYANYSAAQSIGVPAWKSCFVRALEKVQRLNNAFGGKKLNHENIDDSLLDLANQIVITKVLYGSKG